LSSDQALDNRRFFVLIRHSPDQLWNGVNGSRRWDSPEVIGGLRSASGVPAVPNDVRSGDHLQAASAGCFANLRGYLSATHKFDLIQADSSRKNISHGDSHVAKKPHDKKN
jgi:hypothetical protein